MKSENLYNMLDEDQLELLGRVTGGKIIEKNTLPRIRVNVINMYEDYRDWDARQVYDELDEFYAEDVLRATKKLEDINAVFRYINSLEYDEETRKQKLIEDADRGYRELEKNICEIMESQYETLKEEIIGDINGIDNYLVKHLGDKFGFTFEEVRDMVDYKFDFNKMITESEKVNKYIETKKSINKITLYERNEEFFKKLEELFG